MLETKIIISYIVICLTYAICRIHYLLTQRTDEDFNSMLDELVSLSGSEDVIKLLVILHILLSPITAPFSVLRQVYKLTKKLFTK